MHKITEAAEIPSTMNMAMMDSTAPVKAVYQSKYLKEGLKFGAEEISKRKQAKFMTINVMRKVMVIKVAIWLTSENKQSCVKNQANKRDQIGFLWKIERPGKIESLAIA